MLVVSYVLELNLICFEFMMRWYCFGGGECIDRGIGLFFMYSVYHYKQINISLFCQTIFNNYSSFFIHIFSSFMVVLDRSSHKSCNMTGTI